MSAGNNRSGMMIKRIINKFEPYIVMALLILMMIAFLASTIELGFILVEQLLEPPIFLLDVKQMLSVFSFFLVVLICLKLVKTIKMYLDENVIHVEVVILVAIIAVVRKIIITDYYKISPEILIILAVLIIVLSALYFLLKRANMFANSEEVGNDGGHIH